MEASHERGFTLVQVMVVGVLVAVFAAFSLPNLLKARIGSNEVAAAALLRNLASAELLAQLSGSIDVNSNGIGEYAFFAELAGAADVRSDESGGTAYLTGPTRTKVAGGSVTRDRRGLTGAGKNHDLVSAAAPARLSSRSLGSRLKPAPLSAGFGEVSKGRIERSGYIFQLYLPKNGGVPAAEAPSGGGGGVSISASASEAYWCCYAWPIKHGGTGRRCFFVNQTGNVYAAQNLAGQYSGHEVAPSPMAVFVGGDRATLGSPIAATSAGNDGQVWSNLIGGTAGKTDDETGGTSVGLGALFSAGVFSLATLFSLCCLALICRRYFFDR